MKNIITRPIQGQDWTMFNQGKVLHNIPVKLTLPYVAIEIKM